ncbi:TetR/AcrR family transcriptional regulator [Myxococcota bacterium]|nr:TetR/AcrR family transcriptional regulator [Myxococcota bacterium]MBU1381130.1 TetR/AcrR family transcriptional regulator [Myxococcota bacterium]MBU1496702.1 TetR/AcrR family transcriptional regulator [Myxococcota bacterium]
MTPKFVDKETRKNEIALAALNIFIDCGFETTTMNEIATKIGIGKGTFYEYFENKTDLISTAACAWVKQIDTSFDIYEVPDGDPIEQIKSLVKTTSSAFLENPKIIQLFLEFSIFFMKNQLSSNDYSIFRVSQPVRNKISEIIIQGVASNKLDKNIVRHLDIISVNTVAFVDGLGLHYITSSNSFEFLKQVDFYIESTLRPFCIDYIEV